MSDPTPHNIAHGTPALAVEGLVKNFNIPGPSWWQRLRRATPATPAPTAPTPAMPNGQHAHGAAVIAAKEGGKRPVRAVDNVSFTIARGEIFGVLGPNGSGKSTLIRIISTLLSPDAGSVHVFGQDIAQHEMAVKRMISRVSVDAAFFKRLSPLENLLYGARLYGLSGEEARVKAVAILDRLGLDKSTFTEPMEEMSRGMQQKVAIARAFLTTPVLLLLDEPTTGLDPRSKREVRAFVQELNTTHDATILITTHDMDEAEALCNRIAIIADGRVVALDSASGLKALLPADQQPATLEDVFMAHTGRTLVSEDDLAKIMG